MDKIFKVIIAGSRSFNDYLLMERYMDNVLKDKVAEGYSIVVISGTAEGADKYGELYALNRGFAVERYPADWDKHGKSAGYKRNLLMSTVANACVCFWDGVNKGTDHMMSIAKSKFIPLRTAKFKPLPKFNPLEYVDYSDKYVRCITNKFGNFTLGRLYPITSRGVNLKKEPTSFYITDDEHDWYPVNECLKTPSKFVIVD